MREREREREMEKESADRQERTMGVQACIPTNRQSDGGGEAGEKGSRDGNSMVNIQDADRTVG